MLFVLIVFFTVRKRDSVLVGDEALPGHEEISWERAW